MALTSTQHLSIIDRKSKECHPRSKPMYSCHFPSCRSSRNWTGPSLATVTLCYCYSLVTVTGQGPLWLPLQVRVRCLHTQVAGLRSARRTAAAIQEEAHARAHDGGEDGEDGGENSTLAKIKAKLHCTKFSGRKVCNAFSSY